MTARAPRAARQNFSVLEHVSTDLTIRHGGRAIYQAGCRCAACTSANAAYVAAWRAARRTGRVRLGAVVSAREARRHVRELLADRGDTARGGAGARARVAFAAGAAGWDHAAPLARLRIARRQLLLRLERGE
jgi:hypothetical protein